MQTIDVFYLQMLAPAQLRAKACPGADLQLIEAQIKLPELNRFLYTAVGGDWYWVDRLPWDFTQWQDAIAGPRHRTVVAYCQGTPAGYFELQKHEDGSVEILYFGLLPAFVNKGLGGWLLSEAIAMAWRWQATRVWVHTCSLDHAAALANYQARGLVHYATKQEHRQLPVKPPGPWPGAR